MASAGGAVWVTDGSRRLTRIDARSGAVAQLPAGRTLDGVVSGAGAVWAFSSRTATVVRIDPRTGAVTDAIRIATRRGSDKPYPVGIATTPGTVWVLNGNTATVSRASTWRRAASATPSRSGWTACRGASAPSGQHGLGGELRRIGVADRPGTGDAVVDLDRRVAGQRRGGRQERVGDDDGARSATARRQRDETSARDRGPGVCGGRSQAPAATATTRADAAAAARPVSTSICGPVTYGGEGRPQLLIVNSGPLQGPLSDHGVQNAQAVKMVLAQRGWRAGKFTVGVQVCDEASAASPLPSPAKCARNAKAFAADESVVAVLGPVTSTCAAAMLPIVNRAPGGAAAGHQHVEHLPGLDAAGPGVAQGDPDALYPTGEHSFVRMVPADDLQGAASALYAQRLGVRRPYVLHHDEAWGVGVATAFRTAATRLGMNVAGMDEWDRRARDYTRLAQRVRRAGADGVYVAGLCDRRQRRAAHQGSARASSGPTSRSSRPTASTSPPRSWRAPARGPRAWSSPSPRSRRRSSRPRACASRGSSSSASAPCRAATRCTAAQATHALLDAIAASDGTRAGVLRNLLRTRVRGGLLGDFAIDRYGDTTLTEIAVYRVHGARLRLPRRSGRRPTCWTAGSRVVYRPLPRCTPRRYRPGAVSATQS